MPDRLLHINSIEIAEVRALLRGLKHDAHALGCGTVWTEPREPGCPPHVVITNASTLVRTRLEADNVPHVITDATDEPGDVETFAGWTEPPFIH